MGSEMCIRDRCSRLFFSILLFVLGWLFSDVVWARDVEWWGNANDVFLVSIDPRSGWDRVDLLYHLSVSEYYLH